MIKRDKRGQLTLFIVLAIFLVVAVGILFYYLRPEFFFGRVEQPRIDSCMENSLSEKIKLVSLSSGLINPQFNYLYNGRNHTYLCYTEEYYSPCVNQEPFLKDAFEKSLIELLNEEFQNCYDSSVEDLRRRGYEVVKGEAQFDLSIEPGEIVVNIDAPLEITRDETSLRAGDYSYRYKTNLYELLMVATSLIQFETYYGDSEQTTQMFLYPAISIEKQRRGDGTKVYSLTEKNEKIEYLFAVKSYPWPAGGYL